MKIAGFVLLLFSFVNAAAQTQSTPKPQPTPNPREEMQRRQDAERARRTTADSFRNLKNLSDRANRGREVPRAVANDIQALYRDPTKKELKILRPLDVDLTKYAEFLRERKTGIVRLVEDAGCGDGIKVIAASGPCLEYPMPGNGSSYSFREANYRLARLSDIKFVNGNLVVTGILQHGILTGIGDVELDGVTINTEGLEYLKNFQPAKDLAQAIEIGRELGAEQKRDGHQYSPALRAAAGMTYALRSVAYRGNVYRAINGYVYDELDFDERSDIIVAFRIVRMHGDGSITILWKELSAKESPKLKRERNEPSNVEKNRMVAKD